MSTAINLAALAASLWLGLYIITRSPRSTPSRLAALMLWALASYFLCAALVPGQAGNFLLSWLQQLAILAIPLMLHATVRLLPWQVRYAPRLPFLGAVNSVAVPASYGVAVVLILLGVLPSDPPVGILPTPTLAGGGWVSGLFGGTSGPLYLLFLIFVAVVSALAGANLWLLRHLTRRGNLGRPFTALFVACIVAGLGTLYGGINIWLNIGMPQVITQMLLAAAVLMVGYAVARHSALLEGRPMDRDFAYSFLLVGSLTGLYLVIAGVLYVGGQVSLVTLALIVVGTISANSLFDAARIGLDRLFYRQQFRNMRGNLRALASEAGTGGTLQQRLASVLTTLYHTMRFKKGFIALRIGAGWVVEATHEANPVGERLDGPVLTAAESVGLVHAGKKGLPGMSLLIPCYAAGRQLGAIVLGPLASAEDYEEADLEFLEDLGDEIAALIHAIQLHEEDARRIEALVDDFRVKERSLQMQVQQIMAAQKLEQAGAPETSAQGEFLAQVEDGLRCLHDFTYLGQHPLTRLRAVERRLKGGGDAPPTSLERGRALSELLTQTLDQLRPRGPEPGRRDTPSHEWHQYIILHDSYVLDEPTRSIMGRLYIGEGTFNRTRRRALIGLARALDEQEHLAPECA